MIRTDLPLSARAPAFQAASSAAEARAGGGSEPFGDFGAFAAPAGEGSVGLGRAHASIDARHAARAVTAFLLEG